MKDSLFVDFINNMFMKKNCLFLLSIECLFLDAVGPVTQLGCADIVNTTRKRRDIYTELFFGLIISKRKMAT